MQIQPKQAANHFFPNTSLEFVFFEAIANSIDAFATKIDINISINEFNDPQSLKLEIIDNGIGFTDNKFSKFNEVLNPEDSQHKGIGRLVYLNYFTEVKIESSYDKSKRSFIFNNDFNGENNVIVNNESKNITKLCFYGYNKEKIKTYNYLVPCSLIKSIKEHFLPKLYQMKIDEKDLVLTINLNTNKEKKDVGFINTSESFNIKHLPFLKVKETDIKHGLLNKFKLLYSIDVEYESQSVISAICTDGRTIPMEIISNKEFPHDYKMVFILYSDYFDGKTNSTRESLTLNEAELKQVKKMFTKMVSEVINEEIPSIKKHNARIKSTLEESYPHLAGFFDSSSLGFIDKNNIINEAQMAFFNEQKEILEAKELSSEQYVKSLDQSSRILTEYILYRTKIIKSLKNMNCKDNETEIHNLLVPQRRKYENKGIDDIFSNNIWVLDDRFMTYSNVLSDLEVEKIYETLNVEGSYVYNDKETGRPDITILLSDDPVNVGKVDVVIVELKKLGLKLSDKETIVSQLKQRARRLLEFYPDKIQRIWFYGVIDFDKEFIASIIEDGFVELYSSGDLYYKSQQIVVNTEPMTRMSADFILLSYKAMLEDAESRNDTFLKILKQSFIKRENT